MKNSEIAAAFDLVADILEFQNANPFRVRAYRNASRTIGDLAEPLEKIAADANRKLTDIAGIGADLAEKIKVMLATGSLPMLVELQAQVPQSVLALLRIPGLGPKKAALLHKELGIKTLEELKAACEAQKVRALKGFGEKTEATILAGLAFAASPEVERMYWAEADTYAQALVEHLRAAKSVKQIELAGSYRRGRETIGDLDVLVESRDVQEVMDRLATFEGIDTVLGRGETKMSVRLANGLQIDMRIVEAKSYGAALVYFTGSKAHNVVLRGMAKDRGLKINEYGVFKMEAPPEKNKKKASKPAKEDADEAAEGIYIAGRTEKDVYATLDLPWIPPELREDRWEFAWAEENKLPKLIELDDMVGDLHMHTDASDGKATLEEMVAAAQALGLKYIAITDHSPRVTVANGLNADRLKKQWDKIDKLNEKLRGFTVLKGVEVDILEKGPLDLDNKCLSGADWVVASVHFGQNQPREQITKRIVDALANPNVCAIAHPTGRIINRRKPYEVDLEAVYEAALEHHKILELNSNPARLDLDDIHCAACRERGIPVVISTDAHSVAGLNVMRFGILQARRAGLTKADVANTRPWKEVKKLLGRK
ncbi:MAG TPA: DNA polymerase/3'-5' exonuclease PolX [Pirellulales bacterium]|nr:DNA polymerase/3'-5' exonuclease PolX [Pirellulales bacterium]